MPNPRRPTKPSHVGTLSVMAERQTAEKAGVEAERPCGLAARGRETARASGGRTHGGRALINGAPW
jgi:hypothetical protein